jgi:quercetin dioxygenase-like cupin family protein
LPENEVLMNATVIHRAACLAVLLGTTVAGTGQEADLRIRLTPTEVEAVRTELAGAGTSGLPAVTTRTLFGDPTKPGLYAIELRIAPDTTIQAHTHRDTRTAVVMQGIWYFGYGPTNDLALVKGLPSGSFYTEPAGQSHFARTGPEGATVAITGYGPTDTVYAK